MTSAILGTWLFVSLIYNGVIMDPPNPDLRITYEFRDDGTNHLHYHREGERGSCDRIALYEYNGKELFQQVTWVASHNADFCSQDPDMQLGSITKTAAQVMDGKFYLTLRLSDENVVFVFRKLEMANGKLSIKSEGVMLK